MNNILVNNFTGAVKLIDPRLLENNMATNAVNCELEAGTIAPIKAPLLEKTLGSTTGSIFYNNNIAYEFVGDCDIIESPVIDSSDRMYATNGAAPFKTNATIYPLTRPLGIERPTTPITVTGDNLSGAKVVATVSYYYTNVTEWGEESAPSPESAVFELYDAIDADLSNIAVPVDTNQHITKKRIYRLAVGTTGAEYQFLVEISSAITTYNDKTLTTDLGDVCVTETWIAPPPTLKGLTYLGNGYIAGFDGNKVYVTEPYVPYAWPTGNMFSVAGTVVGLGHFGQTMVVCTDGKPVMLHGIDPRATSQENYPESYPCLSKRSIVSMLDCVVYASQRGLVLISAKGVQDLTQAIWSEADWLALNPSTIIGYTHKGRYYGLFSGTTKGFVIDFRSFLSGAKYPTVIDLDLSLAGGIINGAVNFKDDSLHLAILNTGVKNLYRYNGSTTKLPYEWVSKVFTSNKAVNMGAAMFDIDGEAAFGYYDGYSEIDTVAVADQDVITLPAGGKSRGHTIWFEGIGEVRSVSVGSTIMQLTGVE